jgi:hypothetical protein
MGKAARQPKASKPRTIEQIMSDGDELDKALRKAMVDVVAQHRQAGIPLVFSRDGKLVEIPADEVKLED